MKHTYIPGEWPTAPSLPSHWKTSQERHAYVPTGDSQTPSPLPYQQASRERHTYVPGSRTNALIQSPPPAAPVPVSSSPYHCNNPYHTDHHMSALLAGYGAQASALIHSSTPHFPSYNLSKFYVKNLLTQNMKLTSFTNASWQTSNARHAPVLYQSYPTYGHDGAPP